MLTTLFLLALATTPDTAPPLNVKAEYPRIFHLVPDSDTAGGYTFRADSLPTDDPMAALVNPNLLYFEYLATYGTTPRLVEITRHRHGSAPVAEFAALLQRDTSFNAAVLGTAGPFFSTRGVAVSGYDPARPRPSVTLDDAMQLAARFFYPAAVRPDGSIETHVCIGAEGLADLQRPRNLPLEALLFAAINREANTSRFGLHSEFNVLSARMSRADLSSDPQVRLARAQGFLWAELPRSPALRETVLSEYRALREYLPFVIIEAEPPGR